MAVWVFRKLPHIAVNAAPQVVLPQLAQRAGRGQHHHGHGAEDGGAGQKGSGGGEIRGGGFGEEAAADAGDEVFGDERPRPEGGVGEEIEDGDGHRVHAADESVQAAIFKWSLAGRYW